MVITYVPWQWMDLHLGYSGSRREKCVHTQHNRAIFDNIELHGVTLMRCAPIVLDMLRAFKPKKRTQHCSRVQILIGGSPPSAKLLKDMDELGFDVTHAYGLTEATGSALVCEWQKKWDNLPQEDIARLKARQGISLLNIEDVDVKDMITSQSVPNDGKSIGEIVVRGSSIMKGYLNNDKATLEVFEGGWVHTGDIGVVHPDGYIEIKDRLKDVIILGGENICSVEVEWVIKHPKVAVVAVVRMPHPKWGESPCAFVVRYSSDDNVTEGDILMHCKDNLSGYMVPKKICFMKELPKTFNGKVQKGKLKEIAKNFQVLNAKNDLQENNKTGSRM